MHPLEPLRVSWTPSPGGVVPVPDRRLESGSPERKDARTGSYGNRVAGPAQRWLWTRRDGLRGQKRVGLQPQRFLPISRSLRWVRVKGPYSSFFPALAPMVGVF